MAEIYLGNIKGPEGKTGPKGETGNGIKSNTKTSSEGLIDTYTIEYTDGSKTTFEVKNGEVSQEQLNVVDNKVIDTRNELERVKNEVLETGIGNDTYIYLEDSAMSEYQELEVDGVCEQVTTRGVNLYEAIINTNQSALNGLKVTQNNDGSVNVQGTLTTNWSNITTSTPIKIEPNVDYCFSINKATNYRLTLKITFEDGSQDNVYIYSGETYKKFQVTQNVKNVYAYIYDANNFSNINETFYFQVEKGSTPTEYEKFTRGQPSPSPDYPQPIEVIENSLGLTSCNKNLFDTTKIASGTSQGISYSVDNNGIIILNGTTNGNSIEIPLNTNISLNGTYTYIPKISDITKINNLALKDASFNNVFLSQLSITRNVNGIVTKIVIYVSSGIVFNNDTLSIQILKGTQSTATDFIKHLESQITANIPDGEFIGKISENAKDTLKFKYNEEDGNYHLVLNKMLGKKVLNGSENYTLVQTAKGFRFQNIITNLKGNESASRVPAIKSSHFNAITPNGTWTGVVGVSSNTTNNILLISMGEGSTITTVNDFKQWLSQNNVTVYYELATPYEVDLGIVDMPITYNEVTNLFTDSDLLPNINVKYYRNFEKTIQNLQVNEKALKQELIDINSRLSALENSLVNVESEVVE